MLKYILFFVLIQNAFSTEIKNELASKLEHFLEKGNQFGTYMLVIEDATRQTKCFTLTKVETYYESGEEQRLKVLAKESEISTNCSNLKLDPKTSWYGDDTIYLDVESFAGDIQKLDENTYTISDRDEDGNFVAAFIFNPQEKFQLEDFINLTQKAEGIIYLFNGRLDHETFSEAFSDYLKETRPN